MSLNSLLLVPFEDPSYENEKQCLAAWKSGKIFRHSESAYLTSIRECCINDVVALCYNWPNMWKMAFYKHCQNQHVRALNMEPVDTLNLPDFYEDVPRLRAHINGKGYGIRHFDIRNKK